ncbi:PH domain-containing protein [Ornithinibacillus massiliensis]|uniref:PH domain-containing protein n=1 Tax=Ornithinibacillus massiliensis TaxID=1944633 RepID=A0ABS5MEJ1_9BACI|nr:PH domain-containing protein [Ornithinibacillus massiliensis]MBS3680715.1 PH domain-containing protein [Ornithinibacillus massiliensis]
MRDRKLAHTLSPSFPKIRMISDTLTNMVGLAVVGILFWLYHLFAWPMWAFWILLAALVFTIVGFIWSFIEPIYLYRSWSYQVDEEYLQLSYGVLKKEWVTVPMTKVQSVSTVQGPIMKRYQTRSIKVETMGSSHVIPALEETKALELRERLIEYAKLKEVDE